MSYGIISSGPGILSLSADPPLPLETMSGSHTQCEHLRQHISYRMLIEVLYFQVDGPVFRG